MPSPVQDAVRRLHDSPWRLVAACTGAGTGLADLLWREPGSSATVLEMLIPYSRHALADLIGQEPDQYVSAETACRMAAAAYSRAVELAVRDGLPQGHLMGLGLTASVATGRPKRGAHRFHAAVKTAEAMYTLDAQFVKEWGDRASQGQACDLSALGLIMVAVDPSLRALKVPAEFERFSGDWRPHFNSGRLSALPRAGLVMPDGSVAKPSPDQPTWGLDPTRHVIFPGSFNPLHYGHEAVAKAAAQITGKQVIFHMTRHHPVKGEIPKEALYRRAGQFLWRYPVLISDDSGLYVDKAKCFPGFDIVIGADALLGLIDDRHYLETYRERIAAMDDEQQRVVYGKNPHWLMLADIRQLGCRFLVSGRVMDGVYLDPIQIINDRIYWPFRDLFVPISGGADVSSTELRRRNG